MKPFPVQSFGVRLHGDLGVRGKVQQAKQLFQESAQAAARAQARGAAPDVHGGKFAAPLRRAFLHLRQHRLPVGVVEFVPAGQHEEATVGALFPAKGKMDIQAAGGFKPGVRHRGTPPEPTGVRR